MQMEGDGPEGQPAEGVTTLDSLAANMDEGDDGEGALGESGEGEEAGDLAESDESEEGEDSGEAEEGEEEAEEPTFTIKHDGKEVTLKQSELIELGQKGFDYTNKTMALAEERKAVDAAKAQADEHRKAYEQSVNEQVGRLQSIEQFMAAQLGSPPPISLAQQDAAQYLAQKELYENRKAQLEQARTAIHTLQDEQHRQRQAWIAQQADETEKALRDSLTGWNDEMLQTLTKYAGGLGLTPDSPEASLAFLKPGFWQALHKAKAYDELIAKKAEMKPVAKLTKVAKPGNNNQPPQLARRQEAMKRYAAKPSIDTLADLL